MPNINFETISKKLGFSDDDLQQHSAYFKQNVIQTPKSYYRYDASHEPDEWFEPVQVWEVKCADLSLSPVHKAAMGIVSRNFSSQFRININNNNKIHLLT